MGKFKVWIDAFLCSYMPKILAFSSSRSFVHNFYETKLSLKILDDEVPYKLSYFDLSHFAYYCTRKEGGRNREKTYCSVVFSYPILAHTGLAWFNRAVDKCQFFSSKSLQLRYNYNVEKTKKQLQGNVRENYLVKRARCLLGFCCCFFFWDSRPTIQFLLLQK